MGPHRADRLFHRRQARRFARRFHPRPRRHPPGQDMVETAPPTRLPHPRRTLLPGTPWVATSSRIAESMQQTRPPPTRMRLPTPARLATAPGTHMTPVRSMPTLSMGMIPPSTRTLTLTMTACRIRQLISLKVFQKESTLTPHSPGRAASFRRR